MDAQEFLRQLSSQAKADNPVHRTKLGYIDYDFDPSTYPQVLPRVSIDGQGMSERGYPCLSTYSPIPGDRVIMLPHGISYLILGAIDRTDRGRLLPGTYVLGLGKHTSSNQSVSANSYVSVIWDTEYHDVVGGWSDADNPSRFQPQVPGWYRMSGHIRFNNDSTGLRVLLWSKNGTHVDASRTQFTQPAANYHNYPASTRTVYMNGTTDYLELVGFSTQSTQIMNADGSFSCLMEAVYAGDGNNEMHRLDRV